MAIVRSQFYRSGFTLLVWLQKIEKCMATKYSIDLPEMNYIATSLSSRECYDFYNLLSHRRAIRGHISAYAEKERSQEISCISLLATWLTDPAESKFRSNENIELKLREIGRRDLARWVLRKIDSALKRRKLDVHEINRQIEESELSGVDVRNRSGGRIMPITSIEDETIMKNENISVDRHQVSCIFWKIFFSCLIILLLVIIFFCFYRFLYAKLRCICRSFDKAEDHEYCLPEQTYGTTSCSDIPTNTSRKEYCDILNVNDNNDAKANKIRENLKKAEKGSSTADSNDEIFSSIVEEKRALLPNRTIELTKSCATSEKELFTTVKRNESIKFSIESQKSSQASEKSFPSLTRHMQKKISSVIILKNDLLAQNKFLSYRKNIENSVTVRRSKSMTRKTNAGAKKINRSRSENFLSLSQQRNRKIIAKQKLANYREMRSLTNSESLKWTPCACNLITKLPRTISLTLNNKKIDEPLEMMKNFERTICSSRQSLTELSETYDELGMLFSQHLKRQSRPCRRKYCKLTRKLRKSKISYHDVKKCRNRKKMIFGEKIIISWDRRPACSSGNICKDTYDEYEIMRATRDERERLARSIIERRKYFLDQPCLSPVATTSRDKLTNRD